MLSVCRSATISKLGGLQGHISSAARPAQAALDQRRCMAQSQVAPATNTNARVAAATGPGAGYTLLAVDNGSPVSRVAVYVRAGSRYEPDAVPGISHYMRASFGLTSQDSSIFGVTRHTERNGATIKVTSDREYIVYTITCLRDRLYNVLGFIDDSLHRPEFRKWELVDVVRPRLHEELKRYKKDQFSISNEALHKAAFRGGLAHSTFIPEHQIDAIKQEDLFEHLNKNYVASRMSFVGLAVDEGELRNFIGNHFRFNSSEYQGVDGKTRYVGGETRIQAGFPHTMVNYVVEGSPVSDLKSVAALNLIGSILGGEHQKYVKYGSGPARSFAQTLQSSATGVKASIININHVDTGLFGFSLIGPNEQMMNATTSAVKYCKNVLSGLSEKDLEDAKKAARARVLIGSENQDGVFTSLGRHFAAGVTGQGPLELISKLTLKDLQSVVARLTKGKPTLVSVGNPRFVPYIDELD